MRIKSWCDNTGAESASNRFYTGKCPLNIFVQRLSLFSCFSGIRLDVGHIPGERNVELIIFQMGRPGGFASSPVSRLASHPSDSSVSVVSRQSSGIAPFSLIALASACE